MKLLSLVLILCFTLVSCTGDNTSTVSNEVLTGILTLETTFGNNEDGDEKYLLAQPYGLVVDDNMNIIIPDESSLKVYDIQGNPKTILGGPGQGPNEFESPHVLGEISISPNSNVVAKAGFRSNYNIYDKDLVFLKKINHSQGRIVS